MRSAIVYVLAAQLKARLQTNPLPHACTTDSVDSLENLSEHS